MYYVWDGNILPFSSGIKRQIYFKVYKNNLIENKKKNTKGGVIMTSQELALNIRKDVLDMTHISHASHIASALSCADIIAVLYSNIIKYDTSNPKWDERDRVILSKGHAGSALYACLGEIGFYPKDSLKTYYQNGSIFSGHISHKNVPGVEFSTGSLGHGVCVATGIALAGKIDKKNYHVYAIVGDGECDEGSVWETILFSNQYNLNNFTIIIDRNMMQSFGSTEDTLATNDLGKKIKEFGWNVIDVDGHNHNELTKALSKKFDNEKPICIIAHTIKGKGISFMENNVLWHYRDPQGEEYEKAKKELEGLKYEK